MDNEQSREWNKSHPNEMAKHKSSEQMRYNEIRENLQYQSANFQNLVRLRKNKGFSRHKLSVLAGMNVKTIARLENAKNLETTSLSTLEKIASALGMSPVEFLGELYK